MRKHRRNAGPAEHAVAYGGVVARGIAPEGVVHAKASELTLVPPDADRDTPPST